MATKCGRCKILSHFVQRSTILPLASATTMQFSHFASTPNVPDHPLVGSPGSDPAAPPPGSDATGRIAPRPPAYRELDARPELRQQLGLGTASVGQLAAEQ